LRQDILTFYANPPSRPRSKKEKAKWRKVQTALDQLKTAPAAATADNAAH
jgi:hypothetical protein